MTAQVSKVVERILAHSFCPYLDRTTAHGSNQFAYQKEKGARDALAHLVLTWLDGFNRRRKFGVYCSDVSGAFDRVEMSRLMEIFFLEGRGEE